MGDRTACRACHYGGVASTSVSAGALLRHVRTGRARSRADLVNVDQFIDNAFES